MPSSFPVNSTFVFEELDLSNQTGTDAETGNPIYVVTQITFTGNTEEDGNASQRSSDRPKGVPRAAVPIKGSVVSSSNTPDTLLPANLKLPSFGTATINGNSGKVYLEKSIGGAFRIVDEVLGEDYQGWFYV